MGFVLVFSGVLAAGHLLIWWRLFRPAIAAAGRRRLAAAAVLLLWASIPLAFVVGDDFESPVALLAFVWLGCFFYVLCGTVLSDLVRLGLGVRRWVRRALAKAQPAEGDPDTGLRETRRRFLARASASVTLVATGGAASLGTYNALFDVTTPEHAVRLSRLPRALDGFRIVQLSDLHVGPLVGPRFVRSVVAEANRLKPDAVVLTGDFVDGSVPMLEQTVSLLGQLRAPHGVYFVTGNHEYYSGVRDWLRFFSQLGFQVLHGRYVSVGDASASFDLAGVPDPHDPAGDVQAMVRAVVGRDPERELVMLAHQPRQVRGAAAAGVGLQLSGHTHGGQLQPFGALTALVQPYIAGLHQHDAQTQIYVSRGTGFWGPPMRIFAPAEIPTLVLTT